ncbi:MAG: uroporphyrinogen decarboxylase family protein [Planctomycetota bacterium]
MKKPNKWRGVDLSSRYNKIERAFNFEQVTSPEDVPILIHSPCYFAYGCNVPEDYFTNPAGMVDYQAKGLEKHLNNLSDDLIPFFMPWFGTGVLASAFGCRIKDDVEIGEDPAVAAHCVESVADAAKLKMPDPYKDGWMPRVLETIDYACANSDLPVTMTDLQSPLDTLGQMCGHDRLYVWMYEEPSMVHELFDMVTNAMIDWIKVQKKHIGDTFDSGNALMGVWSPKGLGVWMADDDLVMMGPDLYKEFVVPCNSRIFQTFGAGSIHYCGQGNHQTDNLLSTKSLRSVNNCPMGRFETFSELRKKLAGRVIHQIQDLAPIEVEKYYTNLFDKIDDLKGIILNIFICDTVAMNEDGNPILFETNPSDIADRIIATVRKCIGQKLGT